MKCALITGASAGIGLALAEEFAKDGTDLILVARRKKRLQEVQRDLMSRYSIRVEIIEADLSDPKAPAKIHKAAQRKKLPVDCLVNNAGFGVTGEFTSNSLRDELALLQVNVVSLVELSYHFLKDFKAKGEGRILNVASTAAFQPGPLMAGYYASKAYVLSFSEALDSELAGTPVSVTVLCPGATATEFARVAGNDKTPLFASPLARFTVMKASFVARKGYRALLSRRRLCIPGLYNKMLYYSGRMSPRKLVTFIAKKLNQA